MTGGSPLERRLAFGSVAELYGQVRPAYPGELVEQVVDSAQLEPGDRILDVGAGTGIASRQFAATGHSVVALEPSAEMAAVARAASRDCPTVSVVQAEFERWTVPATPFKLVISAQAWHWIDPAVRYARAREALTAGGALAVFWSHVDWRRAPLGPALDRAYHEGAPDFAPTGPMHPRTRQRDLIPDWEVEIAAADGFEKPEVRSFSWRQSYGADGYVRLLSTHSDHIVLDPDICSGLFERISRAIETNGGVLEVPYVTSLCLARAV
jgi:SAM-dependent methyltransferase